MILHKDRMSLRARSSVHPLWSAVFSFFVLVRCDLKACSATESTTRIRCMSSYIEDSFEAQKLHTQRIRDRRILLSAVFSISLSTWSCSRYGQEKLTPVGDLVAVCLSEPGSPLELRPSFQQLRRARFVSSVAG